MQAISHEQAGVCVCVAFGGLTVQTALGVGTLTGAAVVRQYVSIGSNVYRLHPTSHTEHTLR